MQQVRTPLLRAAMRFGCVGLLNTAIGVGAIFTARQYIGLSEYAANAVGFMLGLMVGFTGNFLWTFGCRVHVAATARRYVIAFLLAYFANLIALSTLLHATNLPASLAQIAAIICYTGCFFILCHFFVFAPPSNGRSLMGGRS